MKTSIFMALILIVIFSLSSSGCVEYTNHLSSDFTPIGTTAYSIVNDSNIAVFHTFENEDVYIVYEKFTVKGNITNIGSNTIQVCTINASFFDENKNSPSFYDNDVESSIFWDIKPNQTVDFIIEKKYSSYANIIFYRINVAY